MPKTTIQKIIAGVVGGIILLFTLATVIATMLYQWISGNGNIILPASQTPKSYTVQLSPSPALAPSESQNELLRFRGTIRKETIPAELELGDTWYWLYFDEPYLMQNTAAGVPMYVNKIQIMPITPTLNISNISLDDLDNAHVEVAGKFGWGYAESTLIEPMAITTLP